MKNKVGRPNGTTQTHKTFKLDNDLLDFWNLTTNKNRLVNNLIRTEKLKQLEKWHK